jgi:hypothetical protein
MASSSHYDSYPSKKHDSFIQHTTRDSYPLRYSASNNYVGPAESVPMKGHSSRDNRSHNHDRYYDPRPSYNSRPNTPPPPPHHRRKKRSWPPAPSVEDERISLAKELRPALCDDGGEVVMRGTIDQDPIMIDVENREESRFVLVRDRDVNSSKQSKSEKDDWQRRPQEKEKVAPLPLKVDVDEKTIYTRREPSPYAYTRTPKTPSNQSSTEYFMSPDILTPPSAVFPKSIPLRDNSDPKLKLRENTSSSYKSSSRSEFSDDSDLDARQSSKLREKRTEARGSFNDSSDSRGDRRPHYKRFSSEYSNREDTRSAKHPASRHTGVNMSAQIPRSVPSESWNSHDSHDHQSSTSSISASSSSRPISRPNLVQNGGRSQTAYDSRSSKHEYATSAPKSAEPVWLQTPPASPKVSSRKRSDSSTSSRPGSRTNSRPSSPVTSSLDLNQASYMLSRSQSYQNDRSSTYPPSVKERMARPTSKLTSSMRQESVDGLQAPRIDIHSPSPVRPPLPYPDDAPNVIMPSHEMFQVGLGPPSQADSHSRTPSVSSNASSTSPASRFAASQRPELPVPQTTVDSFKPRSEPARSSSVNSVLRQASKSSIPFVPTVLPPCPRKEFSRKYNDWYTLENNSEFDVCPSCLDGIIRPTLYRSYFKRAPSRPSSIRTRCDFASPWTRLAWLLTLKRQRNDLDLIYAVAAIIGSTPECPGEQEEIGSWYGLRDQHGALLPEFFMCQRDRKCLEALCPSFTGIFSRISSYGSARTAAICSLRTDSRRLPIYLDHLVEIDDKARIQDRSSAPNLKPLIDLIHSHTYKAECSRDRIVIGQTWYYMPSFPSLTICEECYDDAVWPAIRQGSDLAGRFNRVLMPLHPTQEGVGSSCQLYSPRMRRVWDRAVRYDDDEGFAYLTRKVLERKDVESDLRRKQIDIKRLMDRSSQGQSASVDRDWLKRELEAIEQYWSDWE